jgi:hypothetical protein
VLRIYSGTPSRLLVLPGFAEFCKSIAAKRDQKALGRSKRGVYPKRAFQPPMQDCKRKRWQTLLGQSYCTTDPVDRHQQTYFFTLTLQDGVISGRSPC